MNMGNGPMIGVLKAIREKIGKGEGDTVRVTLERDTAERTVEVPADLQKLLNKNKAAKAFFETLPYTHQRSTCCTSKAPGRKPRACAASKRPSNC